MRAAMSADRTLDFRYAVANTEILVPPSGTLETFGNTILGYVLVCEDMDSIDRCRVRTGRMRAARPQIVTPSAYSQTLLEGFGEEARKYAKWLEENEDSVRILRYGYTLRREAFSEQTVGRPIADILADARRDVESRDDPYLALVRGVDEPWDVGRSSRARRGRISRRWPRGGCSTARTRSARRSARRSSAPSPPRSATRPS